MTWKIVLSLIVTIISAFVVYNVIFYPLYAMYMFVGLSGGISYMMLCGLKAEKFTEDPHNPLTVRN